MGDANTFNWQNSEMKKRIDFVSFHVYPFFVSKTGLSPGDSEAGGIFGEGLNRFPGNEVLSGKRPFWIGETTVDNYKRDAIQKNRFEFGKNWKLFLSLLNEERILEADKSLKQMLEISDLKGKSFLDIRSGSGLFSLAARRFGRRNPRVKKSLFL